MKEGVNEYTCKLCDKRAVSVLVLFRNASITGTFVDEKRWFFCQEHGDLFDTFLVNVI